MVMEVIGMCLLKMRFIPGLDFGYRTPVSTLFDIDVEKTVPSDPPASAPSRQSSKRAKWNTAFWFIDM